MLETNLKESKLTLEMEVTNKTVRKVALASRRSNSISESRCTISATRLDPTWSKVEADVLLKLRVFLCECAELSHDTLLSSHLPASLYSQLSSNATSHS